jgi:hypothetical protein
MVGTAIVRSPSPVSSHAEKTRPRRDDVRAQLEHLLTSPLFSQSKHYPSFLRYVVNETLEGRVAQLKERPLGVSVFGRDPDYDTTADPVVRTSACEVRKRIARYYQDPGHENEIRIDLPPGSYVPEFRLPVEHAEPVVEAPPVVAFPGPVPVPTARLAIPRRWKLALAALSTAGLFGIGAAEWRASPTAMECFWNPVFGSRDTVMLALGMPSSSPGQAPPPASPEIGPTFREVMKYDRVAFSDALIMARLTGFTHDFRKKLDIRRATSFTLSDLRTAPVILVGAFNNPWTMRLNNDLRFSYHWDESTHTGVIRDRENPSSHSWVHDPSVPYSKVIQDYAIVSRFMDPHTEQMVVVVGGMGRDGTIAAGEFVMEPHYLETLAAKAPKHWDKKNLQALIATEVVDGKTGPPRILAAHFW